MGWKQLLLVYVSPPPSLSPWIQPPVSSLCSASSTVLSFPALSFHFRITFQACLLPSKCSLTRLACRKMRLQAADRDESFVLYCVALFFQSGFKLPVSYPVIISRWILTWLWISTTEKVFRILKTWWCWHKELSDMMESIIRRQQEMKEQKTFSN